MKTDTATFTSDTVHKISQLAAIPITRAEEEKLAEGFNSVMRVVSQLNEIDTKNIEPAHQVTGLTNVFREDTVDKNRMFTQEEALKNAKRVHDGFFVVDQILDTGENS